jgi:flavin-binding protein dodecin
MRADTLLASGLENCVAEQLLRHSREESMAKQSAKAKTDQDHIYRVIELVGTSEESIDDAVRTAIKRAHKTLRHLRWFEIVRTSGHIENGNVRHFQVTLKVGFTMEPG